MSEPDHALDRAIADRHVHLGATLTRIARGSVLIRLPNRAEFTR